MCRRARAAATVETGAWGRIGPAGWHGAQQAHGTLKLDDGLTHVIIITFYYLCLNLYVVLTFIYTQLLYVFSHIIYLDV